MSHRRALAVAGAAERLVLVSPEAAGTKRLYSHDGLFGRPSIILSTGSGSRVRYRMLLVAGVAVSHLGGTARVLA